MSPGVQKAVIYTLAVHAVALFIFTQITVSDVPSASNQYADIEFFDPSELPVPDESQPSDLQQRLNERIANLRADASQESSSESRSTGLTSAEKAMLEAEVEAELKAMEEEEFDRLSSEEKELETVGMPESKVDSTQIDTMDDWDKQYDGRVTVRFDLDGRSPRHLDVPGYKCQGRADISVTVVVSPSGKVLSAEISSGAAPGSCFALAALNSALASAFLPLGSAPKRQTGMLHYAFVAQ
jgi:hypothetical protein